MISSQELEEIEMSDGAAANDELEAYDDAELDLGAREHAELSARGSHMRRVRRRKSRPAESAVAPRGASQTGSASQAESIASDAALTNGQLTWRLGVAVAVIAAFVAVLAHGAASVLLAPGASALAIVLTVSGAVATWYFAMTVWHALRYRATPSFSDAALPRLTVIVPAYNEGAAVRVALESALANDYPADKLQIIAIDDGSKDDTWSHIEAVAAAHPGRVLVLNREDNLLTRLLSARFFITFDLARAAQSAYGAVLCTPGALSAYRMDAVRKVVERWSAQTFMGQPCTIAEDRALTTWLLREGYRSVYQRTAVVETIMPTDLKRMARMLIRWERGNIREDIVMLPVLATRWRSRDQWWPTFEIVFELVQYPLAYIGLTLLAARVIAQPEALLTIAGVVLLGAVVQTLYTLRSRRGADFFFGVGYALFAFVGLWWVFPYSLVTVRDGRWLTR